MISAYWSGLQVFLDYYSLAMISMSLPGFYAFVLISGFGLGWFGFIRVVGVRKRRFNSKGFFFCKILGK